MLGGVVLVLATACYPLDGTNRARPVPGAQNGRLPASMVVTISPDCQIYADAAPRLRDLINDAAMEGVFLQPEECYRDYDTQVWVRKVWCYYGQCQMAAVPGYSKHGWAKAVDWADQNGELTWDSPGYVWLWYHAWQYDFTHPDALGQTSSSPEAWHWEWIGDGGTVYG